MADIDYLRGRLARLTDPPEPVSGLSRVLCRAHSPDLWNALLQEISETQLARTVTFSNERAEELVLHLKAGRVAKLVAAPQISGEPLDIIGRPLSGADQSQRESFGLILQKFLQDASALWVQSSLDVPQIAPAVTGICPKECYAKGLTRDALGDGATARADLLGFLNLCGDIATAWICVQGGEIQDSYGAAATLLKLNVLVQGEIGKESPPPARAAPSAAQGLCVIICGQGESGDAILSCRSGDAMAFLSFPAQHVAEVVSNWNHFSMSD